MPRAACWPSPQARAPSCSSPTARRPDVDVFDTRYLTEDARAAVLAARRLGVQCHGLVVDPGLTPRTPHLRLAQLPRGPDRCPVAAPVGRTLRPAGDALSPAINPLALRTNMAQLHPVVRRWRAHQCTGVILRRHPRGPGGHKKAGTGNCMNERYGTAPAFGLP